MRSHKVSGAFLGKAGTSRRGVALMVLVALLTVTTIGLGIAVPRARYAVEQAKEQELRELLGEFRRAVQRFRDRNGREPAAFEELLKDGEGRRFLRRLYDDPFTGRPDWVFDLATNGVVIRSVSSHTSLAGVPVSEFR